MIEVKEYVSEDLKEEVSKFLMDFRLAMTLFPILFADNNMKNGQTLLSLEMPPVIRTNILANLSVEDYCEGPIDDELYGAASVWLFGKFVKNTEIYIKVAMGKSNIRILSVAFHDAGQTMAYPFK